MTDRERAILEAELVEDPGQLCAGCGDNDVTDWHVASRGPWLTHGAEKQRCRVPCAEPCRHTDCRELRAKLSPPRSVRSRLDEVLS